MAEVSVSEPFQTFAAYIEREGVTVGAHGSTPFVTEEKPAWRQEQQRTFGKALGVVEEMGTEKGKKITAEWYPYYQAYVTTDGDGDKPIPVVCTASGAPVVHEAGAAALGIGTEALVQACRRGRV